MSDLAETTTLEAPPARARAWPTLAAGLLGGFTLGAIARLWMRLISEEPEFTWAGTGFIVVGFTIFGLTQSIVVVTRRRARRRWSVAIGRALGAVGMLPLFVAAGAIMFPTVIGGGLAGARTGWRPVARGIALVVALAPVLLVGGQLVDSFGWSLHAAAGFLVMLGVYGTVIRMARSTFSRWTPSE